MFQDHISNKKLHTCYSGLKKLYNIYKICIKYVGMQPWATATAEDISLKDIYKEEKGEM